MKLCSQCQFIYEDEQELCDMDGAELVYEPTLEHVFPNSPLHTRTELQRSRPARLVIPISGSSEPKASIARPNVVATGNRLPLQIAAVAVLAAVSFMTFYATPRLFQTKPQIAKNIIATPRPQPRNSQPVPVVSDAAATPENPATQETKPYTSQSSDKAETRNAKLETAFPALPGLKPLPRLKPLATLKPIPKLTNKSRSASANKKAIIVNTNTKKDSGFGSFLKKTGRILTKPFKS
jgi:hypothetical protein